MSLSSWASALPSALPFSGAAGELALLTVAQHVHNYMVIEPIGYEYANV
jgi:hypothetical protein